jgi:hypothetical protein
MAAGLFSLQLSAAGSWAKCVLAIAAFLVQERRREGKEGR